MHLSDLPRTQRACNMQTHEATFAAFCARWVSQTETRSHSHSRLVVIAKPASVTWIYGYGAQNVCTARCVMELVHLLRVRIAIHVAEHVANQSLRHVYSAYEQICAQMLCNPPMHGGRRIRGLPRMLWIVCTCEFCVRRLFRSWFLGRTASRHRNQSTLWTRAANRVARFESPYFTKSIWPPRLHHRERINSLGVMQVRVCKFAAKPPSHANLTSFNGSIRCFFCVCHCLLIHCNKHTDRSHDYTRTVAEEPHKQAATVDVWRLK